MKKYFSGQKGLSKLAAIINDIWEELIISLKQFIRKRVRDEHDAEDILQEIFYKILYNIGKLKDEKKLQVWIYQISRNAIIDYYRYRKTMEKFQGITADIDIIYKLFTATNNAKGFNLCLKSIISHLPEKYKQAIILTEFEGLTQKEMGEKLGLSLSGAKSRVQRARRKLKEMLLGCCQFEFDRLGNIIDFRHKENVCKYCSRDSNLEFLE